MFTLTNAIFCLYSLSINAKNIDWVWKPKARRTVTAIVRFFCVRKKRCAFFMGGLFWGGFGLPTLLGISTPITTPPAPCPARLAVFPKPFKQRSMNHDNK